MRKAASSGSAGAALPYGRITVALFLTWNGLSGCAITPRQAAISGFVTCQAVDAWQTDWALDHGYREANPILGENPDLQTLLIAKAAALAVGAALYQILPEGLRTQGIVALTTPCAVVVANNYRLGVRP